MTFLGILASILGGYGVGRISGYIRGYKHCQQDMEGIIHALERGARRDAESKE